jgi:hypothetical protein
LTSAAYAPADYVSVRAAIEAWGNDIFAGAAEPGPNVAFFFFSGHGTEHMASPALLTKDILNPRSPGGARKAVAFLSLCQAVKTYGIDRALFFVDACRDVPGVARTLNIVGEDILSPYAYPLRSHDALLCLQSTKAGGSAYQVPGSPATIFGQAVIDALDGPPPSYRPYDTTVFPWRLVFKELESHVKQKVRELLAKQTATLIQSVVPYGDPYDGDMLVAQKQGLLPSGLFEGVPPQLANMIAARSADVLKGFTVTHGPSNFPAALTDFSIMHDILGHEGTTDPWVDTLRILDVDTQEPVFPAVILKEGRREQVGRTLTAWVDVLVAPAPGCAVWIGVGGKNDSPSLAVVIPRDLEVSTPVRLDVAFEKKRPYKPWTMTAMSARLHDPAEAELPGVQQVWAGLWEVQRTEFLSDLSHAGTVAGELGVLRRAFAAELRSPVAAAIAGTVCIRCNALEQLHVWLPKLADEFPWLPDGAVLWVETLLRRDDLATSKLAARPQVTALGGKAPLRDDPAEVRRLVAQFWPSA